MLSMKTFDCVIYSATLKTDTYLFVLQDTKLENLPLPLRQALGKLKHVMNLSLTEDRKLAQNNTRCVINSLKTQGYYLQLPGVRPVLTG